MLMTASNAQAQDREQGFLHTPGGEAPRPPSVGPCWGCHSLGRRWQMLCLGKLQPSTGALLDREAARKAGSRAAETDLSSPRKLGDKLTENVF